MIPVTCAIILQDKHVLATQRSETMPLPLKWEFPGGKLHEGETEAECIIREVKEELGIEVEIIKSLTPSRYDYDSFSISLIPFVVRYTAGEVCLAEHRQAKWLSREELINLDWAPADLPILAELLQTGYI